MTGTNGARHAILISSKDRRPDVLLLKIYENNDPARVAAYASLLDDAGIEYVTENEYAFGIENGSVELYVPADAVDEARRIGRTLDSKTERDDDASFRKACLLLGGILGPFSLWALYDRWRFPSLKILLFALACGLISQAAAMKSDTSEDHVCRGGRWRDHVVRGLWEVLGVFFGATIFSWCWDAVRIWFPSFAARVPAGEERHVILVLLLVIVWLAVCTNVVFRLKRQGRQQAAA